MNLDLDSGGALVTASLVAQQVDGALPGSPHGAHDSNCANCGAALTGPYCQHCGQSAHVHRSLLHLCEEFLHGLLHFDTKAWRTLPMLVAKPGRLTRDYIEGKRARYVSPLALFLFMVFLMFFVVASVSHVNHPLDSKGVARAHNTIAADVDDARARLAGAEQALAAQQADGAARDQAQAAVDKARERLDDAETALAVVEGGEGATGRVIGKLRQKEARIDTSYPSVDAALKEALANPKLTLYKLKNSASKFSFLLVPMSLPCLWLMFFWKRGVTMYDHAVFSLYGLSFMALLVVTVALLSKAGLDTVAGNLAWLAPPIHMFLQLRGTYRLRTFSALWRTLVLLLASLLVLCAYLLLILVVSVAM